FGLLRSGAEARQLVRQNNAEGLEIALIVRATALDEAAELVRRIPQRRVLEEQTRSQGRAGHASLATRRHFSGIEIEIGHSCGGAQLVPLVIFVAGRHKSELSFAVAQRGSRQALDEGFAVATRALLVDDEKVTRRAEAKFDPFTARGLHDL